MGDAARARYSFREYLSVEAASPIKHEHDDGEILAMAGGSPEHGALAMRVATALSIQLAKRPCRVLSSDVRVRVRDTGLTTYPDVSVVCGAIQRDPEDVNTVVNPTVIVEVLSPSTAAYDRGPKFEHLRQLASLKLYVLVAQDARSIEVRRRSGDAWSSTTYGPGEVAGLQDVACELTVDEIYEDGQGAIV
jgi:Uma2 family endonuclease